MLIRVQLKDLCGVLKPYIMYLNNYFKYTVNLCQPNAWRNYFQEGQPSVYIKETILENLLGITACAYHTNRRSQCTMSLNREFAMF